MRALVVYESMYGNTHLVAESIARGLRAGGEAEAVPVAQATPEAVAAADLLVVGGPTHVHGMTTERTRQAAHEAAEKPDAGLEMDPDAEGPGLREWFDALELSAGRPAAAFDTRMHGPAMVTGRASHAIEKRLEHHGFEVIADAESFLVDTHNHLIPGEAGRAVEWGRMLSRDDIPVM